MENYIEKFQNMGDIKRELFKIYNVNSQEKLSKALGMAPATLSRIISPKTEKPKVGFESSNVDIIVKALAKHSEGDESMIRRRIFEIVYSPDVVEDKLQELISQENKYVDSVNMSKQELKSTAIVEKVNFRITSQKEMGMLNRIKDEIFKIAKECDFDIEDYKVSEKIDNAVIAYVVPKYNTIFMGAYISMIYGIFLSEQNYDTLIHDVAELNTEDGIIILYYTEEDVFRKAWDDKKLKIQNNLLLYCLSKERKIYVKSFRKKQKNYLKNLFGEERLLF